MQVILRAPEGSEVQVSIRQHTSAYVRIRQHTPAYVSIRDPSYISIRQHTEGSEVQALAEALCQEVVAQMRDVPGGGRDGSIQGQRSLTYALNIVLRALLSRQVTRVLVGGRG